jgi:hypothetical protein
MSPGVLVSLVAGVVVVGVVLVLALHRGKEEPAPEKPPEKTAAQTPTQTPAAGAPGTQPAPGGSSATATPPAGGGAGGEPAKPEEASGIGGAKTDEKRGTSAYWGMKGDDLFVRQPDLDGTSAAEREQYDKDAALFADRDSGRQGTDARARLRKAGRKSVPALLSVFETHWKGAKWAADNERFACYQIQLLLAEISKADRPGGDFVAKFGPGITVPREDFERAARMWTSWWLGQGRHIEKFKDFSE